MANIKYRISSDAANIPSTTTVKGAPLTNVEVDGNFKSIQAALELKSPIASPTFTGVPLAPTATAGTSTTQLATTAFVSTAISSKADLASPTFTGLPTAPTAAGGTSTTQLATTAFVTTAVSSKADLASPTFTGLPTAPTAAGGTSTTQLATTAFVSAAVGGAGAATLTGNNAMTGANTFTNATGQAFRNAATQDGILLTGRAGGSSSHVVTLVPSVLTAPRTLTLPNVSGTVITTGDTASVSNTMLANNSLTVNGQTISLGTSGTVTASTTNALTISNGLSGISFNGSSAITIAVSAANNTTSASYFPVFATSQGTSVALGTNSGFSFNPGTGAIALPGNVALSNGALTGIKTATFNGQPTISSTSGAIVVDWTTGQNQRQTEPTGSITYTFTAPPGPCHLQLVIDSDGTSTAQTFTWPASIIWLGSIWAGVANKKAVINFWYDGSSYFAIGSNQV